MMIIVYYRTKMSRTTLKRFVSGSANLSSTNLISVHNSWDLNSCLYLKKCNNIKILNLNGHHKY